MIDSPRKSRTLRLLRNSAIGLVLTVQSTVIAPAIFSDDRAETTDSSVTARVAVNVCPGPGTDHSRIGVLYPGESLPIRGSAANGWIPVTWRGRNARVVSAYVIGWDVGEKGSSTGEKGFAWTRVKLNARSPPPFGAGARKLLDKGTRVSLTGQASGQQSQVNLSGDTTWAVTRHLDLFTPEQAMSTSDSTFVPTASAPETIGSRWGSTGPNLWTAACGDRLVEATPKGTEFKVTGTVSGGRVQVVRKDVVRRVTVCHLTDSAPAKSFASSGGEICLALFYSDGSATAFDEPFDQWAMKTAHKTLPLGIRLRVTNPVSGRTVEVTVNDRGPYIVGRCLDLTTGAFKAIANTQQGVAKVDYETIG